MNKKLILGFAVIVCLHQHLFAQNNNSPYSVVGVGDIEQSSFDRTSGMGHAGMALFSNRFFYNANPASYSALDDKFFNIEIAARYKGISYSGTPITSSSNQSSDLQFKKVVVGMKIKPRWGMALGILPYSTANYSFTGTKDIFGTSQSTPAYYQGTGSINQLFLANSYKFSKHFSVGFQAAYLFGQLAKIETVYPGVTDSTLITNSKIVVGSPHFKAGFQYNTKLSSKLQVFVGGTATFKTPIIASTYLLTTYGNTTLENSSDYNPQIFTMPPSLPAVYAGSMAAKIKDRYTVAVDYSFQNWNSLNYKGLSYALVNSNHFGAGFEYAKKQRYRDISFEKSFLQAGFFYNNSYLQIHSQQITDFGMTFGGGLNFARSNLGLQINLELGERGTTGQSLIQEDYAQINIILSYRDFWYVKIKKYD